MGDFDKIIQFDIFLGFTLSFYGSTTKTWWNFWPHFNFFLFFIFYFFFCIFCIFFNFKICMYRI